MLSDPNRVVISAYGLADANEPISLPAVYVIATDGVITFRNVGDNTADVPALEAVLDAVATARSAAASPTTPEEP